MIRLTKHSCFFDPIKLIRFNSVANTFACYLITLFTVILTTGCNSNKKEKYDILEKWDSFWGSDRGEEGSNGGTVDWELLVMLGQKRRRNNGGQWTTFS